MTYNLEFPGRNDALRVCTTPPDEEGFYRNPLPVVPRPLSRDLWSSEGYDGITETIAAFSCWARENDPQKVNMKWLFAKINED
jgi:hypothetical protein